jgi:general secretion pathway protein K
MTRGRQGHDGSRERGAALLIVLWASVLIAGLAVIVAGTVRTDLAVARHQVAEATARYQAQAGLLHGALLLVAGDDPVLASSMTVPFDDVGIDLRFVDECGKVDLNTGWGAMVRRLVDNHDPEGGRAAAILDWRDPDSTTTPGGAETTQYRAAGRRHGARNGPFDSIAELRQVLGVDAGLMDTLRPLVTVDCLNAGIDPLAAAPAVLAAIPGVSAEARRTYLADRERYLAGGAQGAAPILTGSERYLDPSPGLAVEITATVPTTNGGSVSWRAVTWLTGEAGLPLLFRTWERASP